MRGAWLDDDDQVGRDARRHDGAARWHDPTLDDPHWTPPSLRGGVHLPDTDATHHESATAPIDMPSARRTRGPWLSDFDDDVATPRHRGGGGRGQAEGPYDAGKATEPGGNGG
ncbi:MAG TPA: hypothetical protein VGI86_13690, partial [Acidimicrobiia bacterium]